MPPNPQIHYSPNGLASISLFLRVWLKPDAGISSVEVIGTRPVPGLPGLMPDLPRVAVPTWGAATSQDELTWVKC